MKNIAISLVLAALLLTGFNALTDVQKDKPIINHIALYVKDLDKSTRFYRDIVGLDTIPEPFHDGKHTWFSIGPKGHLHLIAGLSESKAQDKNNHLCFSVPSIERFIEKLNNGSVLWYDWAGKEKTPTTRVDGVKQIYFTDPDGYWIEVNNDY